MITVTEDRYIWDDGHLFAIYGTLSDKQATEELANYLLVDSEDVTVIYAYARVAPDGSYLELRKELVSGVVKRSNPLAYAEQEVKNMEKFRPVSLLVRNIIRPPLLEEREDEDND